MSKKKVLLRGVFINRDTNGEGVLKVGTTLIRVSTVMGILYVMEDCLQKYTLQGTLNEIDDKFAGNDFLRIHQSFLVNMKFIKNISRYRVLLNNGILLDIARARYKYVEEKFIAYRGEV